MNNTQDLISNGLLPPDAWASHLNVTPILTRASVKGQETHGSPPWYESFSHFQVNQFTQMDSNAYSVYFHSIHRCSEGPRSSVRKATTLRRQEEDEEEFFSADEEEPQGVRLMRSDSSDSCREREPSDDGYAKAPAIPLPPLGVLHLGGELPQWSLVTYLGLLESDQPHHHPWSCSSWMDLQSNGPYPRKELESLAFLIGAAPISSHRGFSIKATISAARETAGLDRAVIDMARLHILAYPDTIQEVLKAAGSFFTPSEKREAHPTSSCSSILPISVQFTAPSSSFFIVPGPQQPQLLLAKPCNVDSQREASSASSTEKEGEDSRKSLVRCC